MDSKCVLTVYLRSYEVKFFEALMSKYQCNEEILVGRMISTFSSIAYTPDELKLLLGNGGDK